MRASTLRSTTFALTVLCAQSAWAQRASFRLTVTRDGAEVEGCLDARAARDAMRDRLGYDPFDDGAQRAISLHFARNRQRITARFQIDQPGRTRPATRTLRSRSRACTTLNDAVSLAMAIAIDPVAAARRASAGSTPESASQPWTLTRTTTGASDGPPSPSAIVAARSLLGATWAYRSWTLDTATAERVVRWHAVARVGLWAPGVLPTVTLGAVSLSPQAVLGFGANIRRWTLRVELSASWPASATTASGDVISLWDAGAAIVGCAGFLRVISLCATTRATVTGASSANLVAVASTLAPGWAASARFAVEPRLGQSPVSLTASIEGLAWMVAPSVRVDGQSLWSRPRVTAGIELGAIVHF